MNLLILVQDNMLPVPIDVIEIVQDYGTEVVVTGEDDQSTEEMLENTFRGNAMLLNGESEAFINWLKPFDGIWVCTNPALGDWKVVHIKKDL